MANKNITEFFGKFAILGLIIFGIFSFIAIIQTDGEAVQPLSDDKDFGNAFSGLSNNLSDLEDSSKNQWNNFKTENPVVGFASIVLFSVVDVGRTFGTLIFNIFEIVIKFPVMILGLPNTITSILLSWLAISLIVALWILYKLGG